MKTTLSYGCEEIASGYPETHPMPHDLLPHTPFPSPQEAAKAITRAGGKNVRSMLAWVRYWASLEWTGLAEPYDAAHGT